MSDDPTITNPELYRTVFENDRVRVLEYRDRPGDETQAHRHPDSVMITASAFERRLMHGAESRDVHLYTGKVVWVDAQTHAGANIGSTDTHVFFVELKG